MLEINPRSILESIPDLAWICSSVKDEIVKSSKVIQYDSREIIFQGDDASENIYIVISGELQKLSVEEDSEQLLSVLYENATFGLHFLFKRKYQRPRLLIASSRSLILSIPIQSIIESIPLNAETNKLYSLLVDHYDAYKFIRSSTSLGDQLSPIFLIEFVSAFVKKSYKDNDVIFYQGDDPDGYYICSQGQLKVIVEVGGKVVFTGALKHGDYFGEIALTTDSKRSATIQSVEDSECLFLSRIVFDQLVKKEPQLIEGFKLLAKLAYN